MHKIIISLLVLLPLRSNVISEHKSGATIQLAKRDTGLYQFRISALAAKASGERGMLPPIEKLIRQPPNEIISIFLWFFGS